MFLPIDIGCMYTYAQYPTIVSLEEHLPTVPNHGIVGTFMFILHDIGCVYTYAQYPTIVSLKEYLPTVPYHCIVGRTFVPSLHVIRCMYTQYPTIVSLEEHFRAVSNHCIDLFFTWYSLYIPTFLQYPTIVLLEEHLCLYYMMLVVCMPMHCIVGRSFVFLLHVISCMYAYCLLYPTIVLLEEHLPTVPTHCTVGRTFAFIHYIGCMHTYTQSLEEHLPAVPNHCIVGRTFVLSLHVIRCMYTHSTQPSYRWKNIFVQFPTIVLICFLLHGIRCIFLQYPTVVSSEEHLYFCY